jgi:hypothetical protein
MTRDPEVISPRESRRTGKAARIERYRPLCAALFDELDNVVEELKRTEKANARRKRT